MVLEPEKPQSLFFRGEVVEICEREGHRLTKIKLDSHDILDIAAESLEDAHLGDKVVIDATLTIKGITSH
jgi:hypothetical protein